MRPNLITRLKEEWNNLDPVDPLRGLISDAIDALAEQPAQQEPVPDWDAWNVCSRLNSALEAIGNFAHDKSTGPAEPDALWEIRAMAYAAIEALAEQPAQHDLKPKFVRNVDGVPCITLVEHEHLMRSRSKPAQQQEPVAWMDIDENGTFSGLRYWSEPDNRHEVALYTSPQQHEHCIWARSGNRPCPHVQPSKPWVGLTKEDRYKAIRPLYCDDATAALAACHSNDEYEAIEAKLREKNA